MITLIAQATQTFDIAAQATTITPVQTIGRLVELGAGAILIAGSLGFLVYLLLGGFHWVTAGGDKSKVEQARGMITQGIIGLAVLASAFALYGVALRFFGLQSAISVGGGGGSSAAGANCSDYCAGTTLTGPGTHPDQCENQGGHRVAARCSGGVCAGNTYPCLIPGAR